MQLRPHDNLADAIHDFDSSLPIEEAWMPPSSWYTDRSVYELERRAVFRRTWQPVARVAEIEARGTFLSGCLAGEPWVLTRDENGVLRAFANTCRHKGREVVVGAGSGAELVCGYHAWTYRLDGRLKSAPRTAGIRSFDREEMSLRPLGVAVWGPWVFINGDLDAAPLAPRLAELDARLERTSWRDLVLVDRTTWTIGCNWKVYVDNYLDGGYHIPHMHPTLDAQIDMETYRTEVFDEYSIQSTGPSAVSDERIAYDADERIGTGAIYAWLYPNFMLNRYGPCLDTNYVVPLGHDRCQVLYEFYFAETEGADAQRFIDESVEQAAVTQREDIAICESVQVGLGSSSYDRGRYAPQVEVGEYHFHCKLAAELRAGLNGRP